MLLASFLTAAALAIPVTVHDGACPSRPDFSAGCYSAAENTIWVDHGYGPLVYWHEFGHAFDAQRMDAGERSAFSCLHALRGDMGDPTRCRAPWTEDDLMEVFADAYANCAVGAVPGSYRFLNATDYTPTKRQHRAACRFINRAAD